MRKTYKKFIALCAVLIFALALIPVTAFADPFATVAVGGVTGLSGAGLFGSMSSLSGVDINYSNKSIDQCDALWNNLNPDSVYFSGSKGQVTEPDPVTQIPTVYDYIKVDIGDWLDAQTEFVSDFVSTYNVSDNSSGNISVPESYNGVPYAYSGTCIVPSSGATITIAGNCHIHFNTANYKLDGEIDNSYASSTGFSAYTDTQLTYKVYITSHAPYFDFFKPGQSGRIARLSFNATSGYTSNYSTNWTSTTVNTGVFDNYTDPIIKIPASSWSPSDPVNWNVGEYLEELTRKMIAGQSSDIIIEDYQEPTPPVPVPTTPLGDMPADEWFDLFGLPVLEGQEEINQDLQDFSSDVSDGIDDVIGELEDIDSDVESIDTNLGIGNGLLGDLKSIGQSIQSTLSSILSGVTDLVQEIVLSTETFIAGLLNSIMGGLGGWLSTMREAFSIWHYVVEWVGSISTVFSWFWSVAGSTSYYIQLPIYAALAGAVVLAFYKRFGK